MATACTTAAPTRAVALLGLALLAAGCHGAHASLSVSASLVSSQTINGQWQESDSQNSQNRYVCAEANGGTFTCLVTRSHWAALGYDVSLVDYAGVLSRSSNPRIYSAGSQKAGPALPASGYPVVEDVSTYRFILAANGSQISVCNPIPYEPGGLSYSCRTWTKMPNPEGFAFSYAGPLQGMFCVNVNEPHDPPWADNFFCSNNDIGLRWSSNGTIPGMKCTLIYEPQDMDVAYWTNNYICVPSTSNINFVWSSSGEVISKTCTNWNEPSGGSSQGWYDNFLCY